MNSRARERERETDRHAGRQAKRERQTDRQAGKQAFSLYRGLLVVYISALQNAPDETDERLGFERAHISRRRVTQLVQDRLTHERVDVFAARGAIVNHIVCKKKQAK